MSYRFTYPNSNLTQEQKDFYEKNGYILIKNNVGDALVEKVTQRFVDICDGNVKDYFVDTIMKDPSLKHKDNVRGQYLINKLQDFAYDEVFWEYCKDPGVISIVEGIIGPNITAVHSMFINKPPNADPGASLHPLHQDLHYFPFRPANKIVASWTALERVDERNGCLYVVPGSHESTLYKHEYPKGFKNALYHGIQGFDHLPKVHVVMDKGDTVFFHPLLLHGSGPNFTKGFRKAISCHYANTKDTYFIDVRGTTQESIATEIETIVQTKRGLNLSYANVWKLKSRLVKGEPGVYQQLDSLL
ncbi:hypothetical protein NQ315_006771 [Exocentrus adspersus]|uniref:phytanoyl-CoA dioxygenase n=1 Tax=Exocentrus adspersus TaxID=1586481 RepID=A0AAV8WBG5_9CUCU|nr:hypothetical protein NQ315_006771 [Exocentrus adspersus]